MKVGGERPLLPKQISVTCELLCNLHYIKVITLLWKFLSMKSFVICITIFACSNVGACDNMLQANIAYCVMFVCERFHTHSVTQLIKIWFWATKSTDHSGTWDATSVSFQKGHIGRQIGSDRNRIIVLWLSLLPVKKKCFTYFQAALWSLREYICQYLSMAS